jgi:hypothetical protein
LTPKYIEKVITEDANRMCDGLEFCLYDHLVDQNQFSLGAFGPPSGDINLMGVIDHIEKEIVEIKAQPYDLEEWIDIVILATDGAWRAGYAPDEIIEAWKAKNKKNRNRKWPDWRTAEPGKAIEHIREEETSNKNPG